MILRSRRKLPITRPSTPASTSVSRWLGVGAALSLLALAACPARSDDYGETRVRATLSRSIETDDDFDLEANPVPELEDVPAPPRFKSNRNRRIQPVETNLDMDLESNLPPDLDDEIPPVVAKPVRKKRAQPASGVTRNRPTSTDAAPRARARITPTHFQPDLAPVAEREMGLTLRPFRKIADIVPYDNYEPDPETAAKDPCHNLCPRPKGGDCPDCEADENAPDGGLRCPECPWEQNLRRIGRKPGEPNIPFIPRDFAHISYCWEPTNLYHNPIYFEDVALERYGHTRHFLIQPFFSMTKMAVQLVGLPYQMSLYPICDKQYSLGYYRPGECVPYKYYQIPLNAKAAVVEAGVISGSYFLFAPGVGP